MIEVNIRKTCLLLHVSRECRLIIQKLPSYDLLFCERLGEENKWTVRVCRQESQGLFVACHGA